MNSLHRFIRTALLSAFLQAAVLCMCGGAMAAEHAFHNMRSSNCGLSFNGINTIAQDSNGFIWIGTAEGLNRYDGVEFKSYHNEELGLQTAFIICLCPDSEGNVWVGTDSGVSKYDYMSDSFLPLNTTSNLGTRIVNRVPCIRIDNAGDIWIAANSQGLFRYNTGSDKLHNFFFENGESTLPAGISSFCIDNNGEFWLSLYFCGLFRAGKDLTNVTQVNYSGLQPNDWITCMSQNLTDGTLLLASVNSGLCELNTRTGRVRSLIPNHVGYIPKFLFFDSSRRAWMATSEGLFSYDTKDGSTEFIENLPDNKTMAVCMDRSGNLWVGSSHNGIYYSNAYQGNFLRLTHAGSISLEGALLGDMASDGKYTWIATENCGILRFDSSINKLEPFMAGKVPNQILGICHDEGALWVSISQGIERIDLVTGQITSYSLQDYGTQFRQKVPHPLMRTIDGDILVGTTLGIFELDRKSNCFAPLPELDGVFVYDILQDRNGVIWLSSDVHGVITYDLENRKRIRQWTLSAPGMADGIPAKKVGQLMEDSAGYIWGASFYAGFFSMNAEKGLASHYTIKDKQSVVSDMSRAMVEDFKGNIWVSSDKGLMMLGAKKSEIVSYTNHDGLLDNEFTASSATRLQDGRLMFGSENGLVLFNPETLDSERASLPLIYTDFRVNGSIVSPGQAGSPLVRNINESQELSLSPRQNSFALSVTIPERICPSEGGISYMLEGLDDDWHTLSWDGRGHLLSWSNVPAGHYTLHVRSHSFTHKDLLITVRKPAWATDLAIAIYIMVFIILIIALYTILHRMEEKKQSKAAAQFQAEKEKELFQDKMSFFTNIIHEIKTPLTLIKTPLQNIMTMRATNDILGEDLSLISANADYMDKLVKEMLDYVRIEQNGYTLDKRNIDLADRLTKVCATFKEASKTKNINLTLDGCDAPVILNADESGITKVLNNLIHNAVKYAESYIRITLSKEGTNAVVTFENDGAPIPPARRQEIFKPFVQFSGDKAPYSQSFGIGLSLARSIAQMHDGSLTLDDGQTTRFRLTLPACTDVQMLQAPAQPAEAIEVVPEAEHSTPLVMVVEDNEDLQKYLVRKLQLGGYKVIAFSAAEDAMKALGKENIDLVVSDIALQGMSGIELCQKIKSSFEYSHIVVIMLSAISSISTKLKAMESGASLYIEKPFDLEYLMSSIKILLEKRESMRASYINDVNPDIHSFSLPGSEETFLRNLDREIMTNLSDPQYSIEQLAEALSLSRSTLIRKVKGLLDTTPNDYIRLKRLSVAAKLLENNSTRISEVCYTVGFNTPSYFAKCFKSRYGVLPNEYMHNHISNE